MTTDTFKPHLGRIRDSKARIRYATSVIEQAARAGRSWGKGHVAPGTRRSGMAAGVRAAAGLVVPGGRRVVVRARYSKIKGGDLGAARAHVRYILRDGTTRDGSPGQLYDADRDVADAVAFLDRSDGDPHQFRIIVSAEDASRLADLRPVVRDLMRQMEQDLGTALDWVAVDHFNTGHPHTHIVVRGRDEQGKDLVIARDYIGHGIRARAESLVTLQLGPETPLEQLAKATSQVEKESLTRLDRSLIAKAKDNVLVLSSLDEAGSGRHTLRIGRLRKLERLGLAHERQAGVWSLDAELDGKLRRLGERADKIRMMQRALADAGLERSPSGYALFERGTRKAPLVGKVVAVGMVDEITDRHYVVLDAIDGRVHYAELGRLRAGEAPRPGSVVSLVNDNLGPRPRTAPRIELLSPPGLDALREYDGPTWLDRVIIARQKLVVRNTGFGAELERVVAGRTSWLEQRKLMDRSADGAATPKPNLLASLREREIARVGGEIAREAKAQFVPVRPGDRISGIYERSVETPTGRLAVIRRGDRVTVAPWSRNLEPMRGREVHALVQQGRVAWTIDRARALPGR